jgi:hypothetical protein
MGRKKLDSNSETEILILSGRRCALCCGLMGDYSEKIGQIAHLDKDNSNNKLDNLCWLCLEHHTKYDSTSSQHKNYTIHEVKEYRSKMYFDLKNYDFDKIESIQNSITKPYSIKFNGFNGFLLYDEIELETKNEFVIETEFKIHNQFFAGVLFNLVNRTESEFLYVIHYSSKHPSKPNQLELCHMKNMEKSTIFSFTENISKWTHLILKVSAKSISLTLNNLEAVQSNHLIHSNFDRIEIGGTRWENEKYEKHKPMPSYLTSYFRNFRLLNKQELLANLEFSYGEEYFLRTRPSGKTKLFGSLEFLKMTS